MTDRREIEPRRGDDEATRAADQTRTPTRRPSQPPGEVNGPKGPEPTRFGDWEKGGRCSDF